MALVTVNTATDTFNDCTIDLESITIASVIQPFVEGNLTPNASIAQLLHTLVTRAVCAEYGMLSIDDSENADTICQMRDEITSFTLTAEIS